MLCHVILYDSSLHALVRSGGSAHRLLIPFPPLNPIATGNKQQLESRISLCMNVLPPLATLGRGARFGITLQILLRALYLGSEGSTSLGPRWSSRTWSARMIHPLMLKGTSRHNLLCPRGGQRATSAPEPKWSRKSRHAGERKHPAPSAGRLAR